MLAFDWTISLGNVLTIVAAIGALTTAWFALRMDVRILRHDLRNTDLRVEAISETMNAIQNLLVKVAVQDERINALDNRVNDLAHGKGFVVHDGKERLR